MAVATVSEQVAKDLRDTLARLRIARTVGDEQEIRASTRRLDWILDQRIPREKA